MRDVRRELVSGGLVALAAFGPAFCEARVVLTTAHRGDDRPQTRARLSPVAGGCLGLLSRPI